MLTDALYTDRLILRRLRPEDSSALHKNCSSDPEAVRYLERSASTDPAQTRTLVESWCSQYDSEDFFLWAIELEGAVIGTINLHGVNRTENACEIGFSIGSRWWNMGVMTEAAGAVVRHAFDRLNFHQITGWCAAGNAASARVMEKIGMRKTNRPSPPVRLSSGAYADRIWYSIRREKEEK